MKNRYTLKLLLKHLQVQIIRGLIVRGPIVHRVNCPGANFPVGQLSGVNGYQVNVI